MATSYAGLMPLLAFGSTLLLGAFGGHPQTSRAVDDLSDRDRFFGHLRQHFEDIHEVSMRFHMTDPSIGGLIVLRMVWEKGRLSEGEVIQNETGYPEEGAALLDCMKNWEIPGLVGPSTLTESFRIKIVGRDHPDFPARAILTGAVQDPLGQRLHGARIHFEPLGAPQEAVPAAQSNREGIFVRTLIPPGNWNVSCSLDGYETLRLGELSLRPGEHRIIHFTLKPAN